jgi:hypothetical protein
MQPMVTCLPIGGAPRAPIRLLYDLHRTARDYPAEVEAYVGAWDESGATLAEGARFIAGLKGKTDVPSIEAAPMEAAAVTVARPQPRAGTEPVARPGEQTPEASLAVEVDGRPARLVLGPRVVVIFGDGSRQEVATERLCAASEDVPTPRCSDPLPPRSHILFVYMLAAPLRGAAFAYPCWGGAVGAALRGSGVNDRRILPNMVEVCSSRLSDELSEGEGRIGVTPGMYDNSL